METRDLLADAFTRIAGVVRTAADGLDADDLAWRPDPEANSIAWLVWHLSRIQDDHLAELADRTQVWLDPGWPERFGLPAGSTDTGYGHSAAQVAAIRPAGPEALLGYHSAVAERTEAYLATVDAGELQRIIDRSYDPPVTVGVRLVSVISDNLQHAGQARYLRGLLERRI